MSSDCCGSSAPSRLTQVLKLKTEICVACVDADFPNVCGHFLTVGSDFLNVSADFPTATGDF